MPKPVSSAKKAAAPRPASPWAVALLVLASGFRGFGHGAALHRLHARLTCSVRNFTL